MLNYIALYFLSWLIIQNGIQFPGRSDAISKAVDDSASCLGFSNGWGQAFGLHLGIVLAVPRRLGHGLAAQALDVRLRAAAVGLNPDASRTAGMSVASTYVMVMVVAGALAGLGGSMIVLGTAYTLTNAVIGSAGSTDFSSDLLGRAKPWGVLAAALLFGACRPEVTGCSPSPVSP
jgi:simple sugar transport system permease protein